MAGRRERTIIKSYLLALGVFLLVAALLYVHFGRFSTGTRWVRHTLEVMSSVDAVLGELKDAETGQRGYLLAGEDDFLEPYERATHLVWSHFADAQALTADNPAQHARLLALQPLVHRKLDFAARTIQIFDAGDRERARAMVASREGKRVMDDIRDRIDDINEAERRLLEMRASDARSTAYRTTALLVFGNGMGFALLAVGTILLGRELNRRTRLEEERQLGEERVAMATSAAQLQRRLETVIDELPVAVVVTDSSSQPIHNARMRALIGNGRLEPRHLDGSPYEEGSDPMARAFREGKLVRGEELQVQRLAGPPVSMLADAAPLRDKDGRVLGAVGVFHDLTELRRTESQRREAEQFRDLFRAALGHDLRNPLSVITAGADSLSRRVSSPADQKLVQRMRSSAQRMARMISQLLELVQLRLGGGIELDRERTELGSVIGDARDQIDVTYPDRTIEVSLDGDLTGDWDRDRLLAVVRDITENALTHGRADAPVTVAARSDHDNLVIEVRNQGTPIPRDLLPLMFDPFRRAEQRKRMKSTGLGISLFLAEQIVRAHGGTIEVTSTEHATTFIVSLPRHV